MEGVNLVGGEHDAPGIVCVGHIIGGMILMMTDKGIMDIVELKALLVSSDDSWGFKSLRA